MNGTVQPEDTPGSFSQLGLLPPSEPFRKLNRLLKKSIKAMRERADVAHFLVPVSRTIYPGKTQWPHTGTHLVGNTMTSLS